MEKRHLTTLEDLVDAYGVDGVLYALGYICSDKAEHLTTNWQDKRTAREWAKRCAKITRTADTI